VPDPDRNEARAVAPRPLGAQDVSIEVRACGICRPVNEKRTT
jgi:D-arabinose 1-dehydrogenase-like Zn-dependent alcohol dehydrogenase